MNAVGSPVGSITMCLNLVLAQPSALYSKNKINYNLAGTLAAVEGPQMSSNNNLAGWSLPHLSLSQPKGYRQQTMPGNYCKKLSLRNNTCDTATGTKAFFDMMYNSPSKVMLFGAACSKVTDPIAKAAKHWHITQLSYADTHPKFSAKKYPNLFRIVPSEKEFNHPRLQLLQRFNWTRVGTLFQNEPRYALAHNHLLSLLDTPGDQFEYELAETQSFADELKGQLQKLIDKDVRIILGYFDEKWARRIFCEAYRKGMYGKNYQWIITAYRKGMYGKNCQWIITECMFRAEWWTLQGNGDDSEDDPSLEDEPEVAGGTGCAVEEIMIALEGCIETDMLPLAAGNLKTVSGKNISMYELEYDQRREKAYSPFHGYTYDGVWAAALAIQAVGHRLHKMNHHDKSNITVRDFKYHDPFWEQHFKQELSQVSFDGVTGPVQFTSENTRVGLIRLRQFQGGHQVKIGEYDGLEKQLLMMNNVAARGRSTDDFFPIYWPGGDPPLDRTIELVEKAHINISIYAVLVTLASLGIVMASIFLAINIKFRNQRYIKMSSPYLNNLIIVGCILTYISVIFLGMDSSLVSEDTFPHICTVRAWILMAGFTLAFGAMFSKTWRVHSIFTDVQLNKKVIKDYQLYMVVFILLCVDVAIMTTWQIVDPFYRHTKHLTPFVNAW
ncbi:unnamed protein product [Meganyctiphanes norvegica]|uniref:Gamma-aminobutyric acid type B receptor subunit 2 n=1 Tax=Meganyctiphanes norvegica TaxID=48144 RepID=A0AAV2QFI5_MEGNR